MHQAFGPVERQVVRGAYEDLSPISAPRVKIKFRQSCGASRSFSPFWYHLNIIEIPISIRRFGLELSFCGVIFKKLRTSGQCLVLWHCKKYMGFGQHERSVPCTTSTTGHWCKFNTKTSRFSNSITKYLRHRSAFRARML